MDARRNPYAPSAGRLPEALVGRDAQLHGWDIALDRLTAGRTVQPVVLYGLRGVGKTVLLTEFARMAMRADWIVASVEAGSGQPLRSLLGEALYDPLVELARPGLGARMRKALKTALSFKLSYDPTGVWSFGIDVEAAAGGGADTGAIEPDLRKLLIDLSGGAAENGTGLAVLVDEAQDLTRDELVAVCSVAHRAGQLGVPLLIALAGLPDLRRRLAEAKSYAERLFVYHGIQQLPSEMARDAIARPAMAEGVTWAPDAVERVVSATNGYPCFLQQLGQDTWDYSHGEDVLTLHDAEGGIARGQAHLDDGFYRTRWDRATRSEKRYLRAMATDGDEGSNTGGRWNVSSSASNRPRRTCRSPRTCARRRSRRTVWRRTLQRHSIVTSTARVTATLTARPRARAGPDLPQDARLDRRSGSRRHRPAVAVGG